MYTWYSKLLRSTYRIYNRLKTNTEPNSFLKLSDNTMWGFVLICFLIQSLKAYCLYHHIIAAFIYSLRGIIKKNQCFSAHSDHCFFSNSGWITLKIDWEKEEAMFNLLCHCSPNHQPHNILQLSNHFHVVNVPTKLCYTLGFAQACRYSSYWCFKVRASSNVQELHRKGFNTSTIAPNLRLFSFES